MISELDLKIIHALQIAPRVDWEQLATVLDVSAVTLARRWETLREAGIAWVTPFPGPKYLEAGWSAFAYLTSTPARQAELIERLCLDPAFATVSLVSGPHDLLVDCYASSHDELMRTLTRSFAELPGLVHRDVMFSTTLHRGASEWRSGTLEPAQVRQLGAPARPVRVGHVPDALDTRLVRGLSSDGRMSWARLGQECGVSAQTAQRRISQILDSGFLSLRCDAALEIEAGQREVSLLLSVPATSVEEIGAYLGNLPGCRLSAEVLGAANLLATLWVHEFSEVRGLEVELARRAPGCTVVSRQATVRHYKRAGRLLDAGGRSCGTVPVPLWEAGSGR
ncbi:MAG: Lrp/AsnC family transcriptional regulator [Arthrobacter sp.]|nr:Lrp/AsnC family transcriptional regulator [Micrococcaceae bacterium]MDN5812818.1 Lrp/AsnC family transcriptional regulator [Micrococcaceae bacterium]MDN5824673.1 Lrp/AsnC family transcriptional regulator [Micrococcaceae bacterium]MDN5878861.1 Lrp/AsnC family transcriptional regulator [Micrococcaceae bacterium]MDN5904981.1 Lrp/AsnC family transcriptional regulator [Micrococcaceae bacterium]